MDNTLDMNLPLETSRLRLRIFDKSDVEVLQQVANDRLIADTMISVPHPFTREHAEVWVDRAEIEYNSGNGYHFGIFERQMDQLLGYVTLRSIELEHRQAELSFWIAPGFWGNGFASEACGKIIDFAFQMLGLNRIYAHHMVRNPSSGAVLHKLGFKKEGLLRQRVIKWGLYEDVVLQALIKMDYDNG